MRVFGFEIVRTQRVPRDSAVKLYGGDSTIWRTGHLDVEQAADGTVVSVWFRCRALPFKAITVDADRADDMRNMPVMDDLVSVSLKPMEVSNAE